VAGWQREGFSVHERARCNFIWLCALMAYLCARKMHRCPLYPRLSDCARTHLPHTSYTHIHTYTHTLARAHAHLHTGARTLLQCRDLLPLASFPSCIVLVQVCLYCAALHHCHTRGVFHRDIKPENLLVNSDYSLKVADFSISAICADADSTLLHTKCGSLGCKSACVW
jgi:serine/threonine protein kinase